MTIGADRRVDALYQGLRGRFGGVRAGGNGYVTAGFFRREQRLVLTLLAETARLGHGGPPTILDIACGSGLMLGDGVARARLPSGARVLGIDFNDRACRDAAVNGFSAVRGDAFALPIADAAVDQAVNCQFLNQQAASAREPFLREAARVLKPGGSLILLWRRAESRLHGVAHALFSLRDRALARPVFPQEAHPLATIAEAAEAAGFRTVRHGVTVPIALRPGASAPVIAPDSAAAKWLGASNLLVLCKRKGP